MKELPDCFMSSEITLDYRIFSFDIFEKKSWSTVFLLQTLPELSKK